MSQKKRQSDIDHSREWERTDDRVFCRDGEWFFTSREGDMGPYDSELEASEQLEAYVGLVDLREENERPVTPDLPEDETVF